MFCVLHVILYMIHYLLYTLHIKYRLYVTCSLIGYYTQAANIGLPYPHERTLDARLNPVYLSLTPSSNTKPNMMPSQVQHAWLRDRACHLLNLAWDLG